MFRAVFGYDRNWIWTYAWKQKCRKMSGLQLCFLGDFGVYLRNYKKIWSESAGLWQLDWKQPKPDQFNSIFDQPRVQKQDFLLSMRWRISWRMHTINFLENAIFISDKKITMCILHITSIQRQFRTKKGCILLLNCATVLAINSSSVTIMAAYGQGNG